MPKRFNIIWFLVAGILIFLIIAKVEADGHKCQGYNCNDGDTVLMVGDTSVDTVIGGSDAFGIGLSMGDVDINDCLASKSTPLYQWLVENKWCMADSLDAKGLYEAAAKIRCETKTLRKVYPIRQDCIDAVTVVYVEPNVIQPVLIEDTQAHHDEERHESEVRALQAQLASFVVEQKKANQRAARFASQQRQQDEDDRMYAQQLIEELTK